MAVRVKLRIRVLSKGKELVSSALVNTGFETEKPQLLLPVKAAEELGLWPPPREARVVVMGTAGGPARQYLVEDVLESRVFVEEVNTDSVVCDAVISDIEQEILINDKLGEALGIVIEKMGSGEWRIEKDPEKRKRKTESPKYWF